jgi:hypothetical protein
VVQFVPGGTSEGGAAPAAFAAAGLLSFEDACVAIDQAMHRDGIGDVLIDYVRGRFAAAVVFLLRDGNALGWRLHSTDPERIDEPIDELSLPLGGTSVLQAAHDSRQLYRGVSPSAGRPVERELWSVLRVTGEPDDMVVVPVVVKERVVNLLYAHGGVGMDDGELRKLEELGRRAGTAYLRLIQATKSAKQNP